MSYRIDPRLSLTGEVRRILAEEIGKAVGHLEAARTDPETALHKCRKRLKNARGLLRLVRSGDEAFYEAENARYREVAAMLAGAREATAHLETVDRLGKKFGNDAANDLHPVREAFVARQHRALHVDSGLAATLDAAIAACRAGLTRIEALALPDQPEQAADILADGARATLRRARKALEHAGSHGRADDFHDLRKAAKAHAMHLQLLGRLWPTPINVRRKAVDALGERLGELHDVFVMRALVDTHEMPLGDHTDTRLLAKLLKRSEKDLRKTCLAAAAHLFDESPKRPAKKLARKARDDMAEAVPHQAVVPPMHDTAG